MPLALTPGIVSFLRGDTDASSLSSEDSECLRRACAAVPLFGTVTNPRVSVGDSSPRVPAVAVGITAAGSTGIGAAIDDDGDEPRLPARPSRRPSNPKSLSPTRNPSLYLGATTSATTSSSSSTLRTTPSRATQRLGSHVAEAFRFMEDSPMFRARLAGFEARAKRLLEKLSKVVKTTERYLASGKIFARATASLATDFIEM